MSNWSIERKVFYGFALAIIVVIATAGLAFNTTSRLIKSEKWVSHTHEVLSEVAETFTTVQEAESMQEGFLITAQERFLISYDETEASIRKHIVHLRELTADNPNQQQRITTLESMINTHLDSLRLVLALKKAAGSNDTIPVAYLEMGRREMDNVRDAISGIRSAENELLAQRAAASERDANSVVLAFSSCAVLLTLLLGLAYYIIRGDMTNRVRSEQALSTSEHKFRTFVESLGEGLIITDLDDVITYANRRAYQITGFEADSLMGQTAHRKLFPPAEWVAAEERGGRRAAGVLEQYETQIITAAGEHIWVTINASPIASSSGQVVGTLGAITDITERKKTEAELQESQERFRRLAEATQEGVAIHSNGFILEVNRAFAEMFGYDPADLPGMNVQVLITPGSRGKVEEKISAESEELYEVEGVRKDASVFPMEVRGRSIPYHGSNVRVTTVRDLTERKRTEQALVQSEQEYRGLFENAHDAILILAPEGEIVLDVNGAACELYGYEREEFIGRSLLDMSKNPEQIESPDEETLAIGGTTKFETVQYRSDGTELELEVTAAIVDYKGQRVYLSMNRDVTERKKAQEALRLLATRDALTGLLNRHEMHRTLAEEVARCQRYNRPLSLAMIDIDHFKRVNDTYGHGVGDEVLRWIGRMFLDNVRNTDHAARYGGEEVALILPETGEQEAAAFGERFRSMVAAQPFICTGDDGKEIRIPITISVGVAALPDDATTEVSLLIAADRALYRAKHAGRNRVISHHLYATTTTSQLIAR